MEMQEMQEIIANILDKRHLQLSQHLFAARNVFCKKSTGEGTRQDQKKSPGRVA